MRRQAKSRLPTKSKYKPKFHDSKGSVIPENSIPPMYGGSVLKLKGTMTPYDTGSNWGVTMNLTAVQIIEPVSQPQDSDGFDAEEGGFVVSKDDANDAGVRRGLRLAVSNTAIGLAWKTGQRSSSTTPVSRSSTSKRR